MEIKRQSGGEGQQRDGTKLQREEERGAMRRRKTVERGWRGGGYHSGLGVLLGVKHTLIATLHKANPLHGG